MLGDSVITFQLQSSCYEDSVWGFGVEGLGLRVQDSGFLGLA